MNASTTETIHPSALTYVALTLGGHAYVSRAALESGSPSMRAYTKAGKPRSRRNSASPLYIGPALIHPAYRA